MKFTPLSINGLVLIEPDVYPDPRGLFFELYNKNEFLKNGITVEYMQDNVSVSKKNVIRGLHMQVAPHAQGKLVSVVKGGVIDVAVDVRKDSATFGKYEALELSASNKRMLWIPPGFAHGFAVLEDDSYFLYKCSDVYHKASEMGIRYDDPDLNIAWGISNPIVSEKDLQLLSLKEFRSRI